MLATKFRPALESLDARVLPSAVLTVPHDTAPVISAPLFAAHPLHGAGQGGYTEPAIIALDTGVERTLHGTVTLQGLGTFDLVGTVRGTGMILNGRATGHLVLTNAHGSLTLELHGPIQPGFAPLPSELVYAVSGGTGAYAHAKGYGVTHLTLIPYPMPMPPETHPKMLDYAPILCPTPMPHPGGHFNIAFN